MMQYTQYDTRNIIEITIDGAITKAEIDLLIGKLDGMIHEFGKIRVVEVIKNIGKIEPAAMWADLKWEPRHITSFSHVAVVADQKWIEWMVKPLDLLIPAELKLYHLDELEEARDWIQSCDSAHG
jgi:hypothetical protein